MLRCASTVLVVELSEFTAAAVFLNGVNEGCRRLFIYWRWRWCRAYDAGHILLVSGRNYGLDGD